ncbi:MAG: ABC transporter permease [Thermoflexales bacterium]|nr:ABC transporter permease [Thermoflexales bacterium]MCS7325412.1 ABC transporter permease [Thermoflexales bacterium]MCX7938159.1 ABC transporter permease [Thermoflexales bacterium]MDW8054141.1 ABC transporter permease [Anaerolineae bacterium]MDW8292339.1 ABC transporter permease [Anaerolineae bacterium]
MSTPIVAEKKRTPEEVPSPPALWRRVLQRPETSIVILLLLLSAVLSQSSDVFLTPGNLFNILRNNADIAIAALGVTLVIIAGGIDLSVGSTMAFSGLVAAMAVSLGGTTAYQLPSFGLPPVIAFMLGVLAGALVGAINGLLVVKLRIVPFIATLGMLGVVRGIVVGLTSGQTVRNFPIEFTNLGQGFIGPVPVPVVFMVVLAVLVGLFLAFHVWGTYIYAIGGNETSAVLTGLPVNRIKWLTYILCGTLAGVGGVLVVARLGVSAPTQALGYELYVIASAVIGGVSLSGGRGTVLGAVLGAVLIGVLNNALVLLRVESYWQQAFTGGIILLSALIDRLRQRRS